jgi:hypothetical protein
VTLKESEEQVNLWRKKKDQQNNRRVKDVDEDQCQDLEGQAVEDFVHQDYQMSVWRKDQQEGKMEE